MDRSWSFHDIEEYLSRYGRFFSRSEALRLAAAYIMGLLSEGMRKSVEPMARRTGVSVRSLQRLLTEVKWDHEAVLKNYREYMYGRYSRGNGVLAAGLIEFPKRGGHSVCVARQYSFNTGRMMSCQTACDIIHVENDTAWPVAMELYVPRFWGRHRDEQTRKRRAKAGVPNNVYHRKRWELALEQISAARSSARMSPVVSVSRAFGPEPEFLDKLDESGCRYVAEVLDSFEVFIKEPVLIHAGLRTRRRGRPRKPSFVLDSDKVPVRVSSVGICPLEKDPLQPASQTEDVPETQVLPSHTKVWPAPGWRDGIVHKPVWLAGMQGIHPAETSFAVSNVPEDLLAGDLAMSQRAQDIAQKCERVMRHELGLAHHEGRSWDGWHRHVVLVFLAWGFILERRRSA